MIRNTKRRKMEAGGAGGEVGEKEKDLGAGKELGAGKDLGAGKELGAGKDLGAGKEEPGKEVPGKAEEEEGEGWSPQDQWEFSAWMR